MKKPMIQLLGVMLCITGITITTNSCNDNSFVDFHKIAIPEYTAGDYLNLLDNPNADVVYNAISNLADEAGEYGRILSADSIADTTEYHLAKDVYAAVSEHISSGDEWVRCSAIRFMTAFGFEYEQKDEVIEMLLGVKDYTKSTRLEMMDAFINTEAIESVNQQQPVMDKVTEFINERSWLVSRYAYPLTITSDELISDLLDKYSKASEDFEKLLIIQAVADYFDDKVFDFLAAELQQSEDEKIRSLIIKSLGNAQDEESVVQWVSSNIAAFENDKEVAFQYYTQRIDTKTGSAIVLMLIENGFDPESILNNDDEPTLYQQLYSKISSHEGKEELNEDESKRLSILKDFENKLMAMDQRKIEWISYKEEHMKPVYSDEMLARHQAQMEDMIARTNRLFTEYGLDAEQAQEYKKQLEQLDGRFFNKQ